VRGVENDGRQDLHVVEATGGDDPHHLSLFLPCSRTGCCLVQGSRHLREGWCLGTNLGGGGGLPGSALFMLAL
jgi:hypothetical protein